MEVEMPIDHHVGQPAGARTAMPANHAAAVAHPQDVVEDAALSLAEKREILAAWASDANAVPDRPWLRQLESGFQVPVREIVEALKSLDELERASRSNRLMPARRKPPSDDDDGDDPTPSPLGARPPPGRGPVGPFCQGIGELIAA
jgi:hypothetical protein